MSAVARTIALLAAEPGGSGGRAQGWRILAVVSVAAGAGAILAGVGLMGSAGYLVSRAAERPPILDLALVFVAVRFFGLARPALRYAERLVSHDVTLRLLRHVRRWFCDALVPLATARLRMFRQGDLLARLAADVDALQDVFLRLAAPVAVALVVGTVVTAALAAIDPPLAALVAGLLILNGAAWPLAAVHLARGAGRERNRARGALTADLVALRQGLEEVVAFGREDSELARIQDGQRALDAADRRLGLASAVHVAVSSAVSGAGVWAVLLLLAVRVHQGRLDGIWVAAVTLAVLAAFEAVEGLPLAWQAREQTGDAATRVFEVVDATPAVAEPVGPPAPRPSEPRQGVPVRVEGVTLRDGGRAILRDLSIAIEPGEHLAVVGPSGAGKSTLVALLVRLVDPDEGCLEVGGVDVRRLRPADLRGSVAMLPQQVHVFDETLRENVRLARPRATDAEVAAALAAARLEALAAALPHGLDTRLGEAGARLSAGERQRLGLARVFLSDAPLVLLDEPTAHLDVATERDVLSSARAWARGRTAIVVSHRLACVRRLDRLVVLDRGAVAGSGSHERLLERCEVYRALWHAERQALIDTLPEPDGTGL